MGMADLPPPIIKETIMNTLPARHCPARLTDQPTTWSRLYFLPPTHYVKRRRAANSPKYYTEPRTAAPENRPARNKQSYLQRCTHRLTAARKKAWASLKRLGRKVVHKLVKWCLLPLAIAACFAMVDVAPADLPVEYYTSDDAAR